MRFYLDSRDYIDLLERGQAGIDPGGFRELLVKKGHTLVFSFPLICELIAPLWDPGSETVIARTLNQLEQLPHLWIDVVRLPSQEVRLALACYKDKVDYRGVDPYVQNFVATFSKAPELVGLFLHYPLAEAAFDLWRSGTLDPRTQNARHVLAYRQLIEKDRELITRVGNKQQARRMLFIERVVQRIERERLHDPEDQGNNALFRGAAEYTHANSCHCPSLRLSFATFHSLVDDLGDQLSDGDLGDLAQLYALPYVDVFTTDRRIATHIQRAGHVLGIPYHERVRRNIADLLNLLS